MLLQFMKAAVGIQAHDCVGADDILTALTLATCVAACGSSEPWLFCVSRLLAVDHLVP